MPSKKYRFESDGAKRLEISWSASGAALHDGCNYVIKVDGETLATIPTAKELETEQAFQLPDGAVLVVKIDVGANRFYITRDGVQIDALSEALDVLVDVSQSYFLWGGIFILGGLFVGYNLIKGYLQWESSSVIFLSILIVGMAWLLAGYLIRRRAILVVGAGIALSVIVLVIFLGGTMIGSLSKGMASSLPVWWIISWLFFTIDFIGLEIRAVRALLAWRKVAP